MMNLLLYTYATLDIALVFFHPTKKMVYYKSKQKIFVSRFEPKTYQVKHFNEVEPGNQLNYSLKSSNSSNLHRNIDAKILDENIWLSNFYQKTLMLWDKWMN